MYPRCRSLIWVDLQGQILDLDVSLYAWGQRLDLDVTLIVVFHNFCLLEAHLGYIYQVNVQGRYPPPHPLRTALHRRDFFLPAERR